MRNPNEPVTGFSYFGVRNPEYVRMDLRRMKSHGATAVLFTLSEEDVEFYRGTMREMVSLAHKEGLLVYANPWGLGGVFGGESYSKFVAWFPDERQVDATGRPVPAACFNSPVFREFVHTWVKTAADCGVDVAMWDEPHFFMAHWADESLAKEDNVPTCFCRHCQTKFRQQFGFPMPHELTPEVLQFREDSLVEFLTDVSGAANQRGLQNSVCILPPSYELEDGITNPARVAAISSVQILATDPYWEYEDDQATVEKYYRSNGKLILQLAQKYGKEPEMWIKNFKIRAGTEPFVSLATEITARLGIRRIFAWSYLGSAYMSSLQSDNPYLVFDLQGEAFQKVHAAASNVSKSAAE